VEVIRAKRQPLRILVAEDNPINQVIICKLLEQVGHTVMLVENGERALDFYETEEIDLAILDDNMPERTGHEVVSAGNGVEAWEKFDREPVRAIISDWMMPDMDGLELCAKVRERPKTEYTYFILLTANNTVRDNLRKAMDAGIDDFLAKPLDREAVVMRLRVAERILEFTTQIRQLKELIPICMFCKRVRDDTDYWQQVESYIHTHTGAASATASARNTSSSTCPSLPKRPMINPAPSP
jgi:CheY-like chemotaxis protein